MTVRRVVSNIKSEHFDENRAFYAGFLGLAVAMDMGWILTFASSTNPTAQVTIVKRDATAPLDADLSIEVTDVDAMYAQALRRGIEIVYPLTDEPWGMRRFFVRDPNGLVVNLASHGG